MRSQQWISIIFFVLGTLLFHAGAHAQKSTHRGTIKGKIIDAGTQEPLIGANVTLANTNMGAATDLNGEFTIANVPVGHYSLRFTYIGYEPRTQQDIIVRSKRITYVHAELPMTTIAGKEVVVTAGAFNKSDQQPTSSVAFSREEIRRAPGSAGDVSRIIQTLPSIAKIDDQRNSLVVRGGSPIENTFYLDNIEIPNINHFPSQGASGGPIGIINVDFIDKVEFYTGGFSAKYGDKLSSVMNLTLREGNRSEFDGQVDLNFAGFGGVLEGPILQGKGSVLVSARRSYLDLLVQAVEVGSTVAPRFGDAQAKVVYDLNGNHKLTILGVWSDDHMTSDQTVAAENDMVTYGNQDIYQATGGVNWRAIWHKSGFSNTSVSYNSAKFNEDFFETGTGNQLVQNRSFEQTVHFRNVNHFRFNPRHSVEFGIEAKYLRADYDNLYASYTDALGNPVPPLKIDKNVTGNTYGAFASYIVNPFDRLTMTLGMRADYASINKRSHISPRLALTYRLSERTNLNASTGIFYQNLPSLLLAANSRNRDLDNPEARHYILGIDHLITENTKLTVEVYQKDYSGFPLDPNQPGLFLLDEIYYRDAFFFSQDQIIDSGKAQTHGIEFMIQKKLAKNFYGLVSASAFRSRYQDANGTWRDRIFDNRFLFSLEGGYKPNNKWEFSARWIFAGGRPYTPFDVPASQVLNRSVLDANRINAERYPDYHSLNLRVDRRFYFSSTNLVAYISIWNAYNRKNAAAYYWNQIENKPDVIYQWGMLPIFGLEFEF